VGILTYVLSRKYDETYTNRVNTELMNDISISEESNTESVSKLSGNCKIPTENNPFMNPEIYDYNTKNSIDSCGSYNNKGIQRDIDKKFNTDLYRDVNDIFGKSNSQRQFYTVPGSGIPNDQSSFAKWLYLTPRTCKEGNGLQCAANQYGTGSTQLSD
jgi:hypothetical protein